MCRKFVVLIPALVLAMAFWMTIPVQARTFSRGNVMRVLVNGETAAKVTDMSASASVSVPVRSVCEELGALVRWNPAEKRAEVTANGKTHTLSGVIRDGRFMSPANDVAEIFDMNVSFDSHLNTVSITRGGNPTGEQLKKMLAPTDDYNPEDIYWLSRIVEAEARGENYDSRLAVANVVLNRKASGQYPETVKSVIFDRKFGVQFTPVANGAVYNEPSDLSFLAALDALDGYNNVPGALFFMAPHSAQTLWIEDNREMAFTVGGHTYYY